MGSSDLKKRLIGRTLSSLAPETQTSHVLGSSESAGPIPPKEVTTVL